MANINKTHFLREISKSMHIKKVAKKYFFATSLAASVGYNIYWSVLRIVLLDVQLQLCG